ncbi:MAG TPA: peptidylprolyl isomerase [Chthoniobacterales bacterium]
MKRTVSALLVAVSIFACAEVAHSLTVKPNLGPVVSNPIADYQQYVRTTRVIHLANVFTDQDASAAARLVTPLGTMNFTLDGATAPLTVANFLRYVNEGAYFKTDPTNGQLASTFFHRSVSNFVIQAGGFVSTVNPNNSGNIQPTQVATFGAVQNEPFISNTRGTIAMAKLGSDPNSATSQWFINLADNSTNLDTQNGGFTVFGHVAGDGMNVADGIAALPKFNFGSPFNELPLRNYNGTSGVKVANLVTIPEFTQISPLNFTASSNNPGVEVSVSGTDLVVTAFTAGSAQITVTATDLDGLNVQQSFNVNVIEAPARVRNISTRANFPNGSEPLSAGFIVRGGTSKRLVVRARGPSTGLSNAVQNPTLSLVTAANDLVASNDNWKDSADRLELEQLGLAPTSDNEAALIATVPSKESGITNYAAVMRSADGTPGVGIVEVFDIDFAPGSTLRNVSTLGAVGTETNVLIAGFIVRGNEGTRRLLVRGVGPSLANHGISNTLPNPTLKVVNAQGTTLGTNDDWQSDSAAAAEIMGYNLQPQDPREAAVLVTVGSGEYTATLAGTGDVPTGTGIVEVFVVQ